MNIILSAIVIGVGSWALCAWMSEEWLRGMAARLMTRAEVLRAMRTAHKESLPYWQKELGFPAEPRVLRLER
jgi:hypothetical protein